jgi:hypothetical protein
MATRPQWMTDLSTCIKYPFACPAQRFLCIYGIPNINQSLRQDRLSDTHDYFLLVRLADSNKKPQITPPHHKLRSYHAAGHLESINELISEPDLRELLLVSPHYTVSGDLDHVNMDFR